MSEHLPILVRAAEPADVAQLTALMNLPGYRHGTLRLPFESVDAAGKRIFNGSADITSLVAEWDGRIVGNLGLWRQQGRRSHVGRIGMGVHDDFTGRGIGRQLLMAAIEVADDWLGLLRLELSVNVDNAPAIRLYESCGFETEGCERRSILRAGELVDAYTMARLREPPRPGIPQSRTPLD
ncbi:GNAT family N-acetyltransferase [Aureimonas jatrophae]|uniref:Putative acetyltransferase n=1 Tax=Aureimonas jatrophae TaxID=1166073 RepID=A0A1H0K772_9HYPH|nr:GNAT family N-acetyltransferase [Aureimonas jatrophae]MBB3950976.1 putative acetyltransferase [Aureimonas jatrophae]SDO51633.1 putative acetyltransferase [Aureimonas jatrophae]